MKIKFKSPALNRILAPSSSRFDLNRIAHTTADEDIQEKNFSFSFRSRQNRDAERSEIEINTKNRK